MIVRDAEKTRETLVQAAFEEIYANGFQAASMNEIIRKAGATKGAMYHHFKSKTELGFAVIDEIIRPMMRERWLTPLQQIDNPIDALIGCCDFLIANPPEEAVKHGCPLGNLAHEMSALEEGFRLRLRGIIELWQQELERLLKKGMDKGYVREDINPGDVGCFIVASIEGAIGVAKNSKDPNTFKRCGEQLRFYMEMLRPPDSSKL